MAEQTLEIDASVSDADWDEKMGGWRCDALRLPGAEVSAMFADGGKLDDARYRVDGSVLRWVGRRRPSEATLKIRFGAKGLVEAEKEKRNLEAENKGLEESKLALEREKAHLEYRGKKLTAIVGVVTAVIGAVGGAAFSSGGTSEREDGLSTQVHRLGGDLETANHDKRILAQSLTSLDRAAELCREGIESTQAQAGTPELDVTTFTEFVRNQLISPCQALLKPLNDAIQGAAEVSAEGG